MAKKTASKAPAGFVSVDSELGGFFERKPGNIVQGFVRGDFVTKSKFHKEGKRVYRIEITEGLTAVMLKGGKVSQAGQGETIGLDETGYLKKLERLDGREVWIECVSKGDAEKDPWIFDIRAREE